MGFGMTLDCTLLEKVSKFTNAWWSNEKTLPVSFHNRILFLTFEISWCGLEAVNMIDWLSEHTKRFVEWDVCSSAHHPMPILMLGCRVLHRRWFFELPLMMMRTANSLPRKLEPSPTRPLFVWRSGVSSANHFVATEVPAKKNDISPSMAFDSIQEGTPERCQIQDTLFTRLCYQSLPHNFSWPDLRI